MCLRRALDVNWLPPTSDTLYLCCINVCGLLHSPLLFQYMGGGFYRESQPTHPRTTPSSPGTGAETCKREKPNRRKKEAVVQSLAGPPNSFESGRKHFYWSAGKRRGDTRDVTNDVTPQVKIPYIVFPRNENSIGNFSSLSLPEARLGLSVKVNHIRQCYFCFRFWFTNRIFLPLLSFGESELYGSLIAVTKLGECPTHARGKCQKLAQQFLSISMTTLSAEMAVCIRDILSNSELSCWLSWTFQVPRDTHLMSHWARQVAILPTLQ